MTRRSVLPRPWAGIDRDRVRLVIPLRERDQLTARRSCRIPGGVERRSSAQLSQTMNSRPGRARVGSGGVAGKTRSVAAVPGLCAARRYGMLWCHGFDLLLGRVLGPLGASIAERGRLL